MHRLLSGLTFASLTHTLCYNQARAHHASVAQQHFSDCRQLGLFCMLTTVVISIYQLLPPLALSPSSALSSLL